MASNIVEVTETNFEYEVVAYSRNNIVIVDFWAEWCVPCKTLGIVLEKLMNEAPGNFRLARVNVDLYPNLAAQFSIGSLPTLKAFSGGQVVAELVGNQPEARVRDFISRITPPSPYALKAAQVEGLLRQRNWLEAVSVSREILNSDPDHMPVLLSLAISLLGRGQSAEALEILADFPASKEFQRAQLVLPYARVLNDCDMDKLSQDTDLDLAFSNAIHLAKLGKFEPALDGLMDILRQDKRFGGGLARQVILALLEVISGSEEAVRRYRAELASILF